MTSVSRAFFDARIAAAIAVSDDPTRDSRSFGVDELKHAMASIATNYQRRDFFLGYLDFIHSLALEIAQVNIGACLGGLPGDSVMDWVNITGAVHPMFSTFKAEVADEAPLEAPKTKRKPKKELDV